MHVRPPCIIARHDVAYTLKLAINSCNFPPVVSISTPVLLTTGRQCGASVLTRQSTCHCVRWQRPASNEQLPVINHQNSSALTLYTCMYSVPLKHQTTSHCAVTNTSRMNPHGQCHTRWHLYHGQIQCNLNGEVLAWLSVWSEVQMICIWSS